MMKLRRYLEGDMNALTRVGVAAFGGRISDWEQYFDPAQNARLDLEQVHVIEEDGEVRASTTVLPLESFVEGEPHQMGGIAAVMAHPAYRRRGYAGELMRAVLRDMRVRDVALSLLSPFAHAFYRVFGYELVTEEIEYRLKPADLPTSPEQSHLRAYREEDLTSLMELYTAEAKGHTLSARRSEGHWKTTLSKKDAVVAATQRAREALYSFMAGLDPLVYGIKLYTPRGEPLHPYLKSSHVDAKIEPDQMLRLVDVEVALGYLGRAPEAPLVLDISDAVIPENAGEYTFAEGKVVRGAEAAESAFLDVRHPAQFFAGDLPAWAPA